MKKQVALLLTVLLLVGTVFSALVTSSVLAEDVGFTENFNRLTTADIATFNGQSAKLEAALKTAPEKWHAVETNDNIWYAPAIKEQALNINTCTKVYKRLGGADFAKAGDTYIIKFKAKNTSSSSRVLYVTVAPTDARFEVRNDSRPDAVYETVNIAKSNDFVEYTKTVTLTNTNASNKDYVFSVYHYNSVKKNSDEQDFDLLVDDISVQKKLPKQHIQSGLLMDGDFEYYSDTLGSMNGKLKNDRTWGGQATYIQESNGNTCISLAWRVAQYVPNLKSNTTYIFTKKYKRNPAFVTSETNVSANYWVGITKVSDPFNEQNIIWLDKSGFHKTLPETFTEHKSIFTTPELETGVQYALIFSSPATGNRMLIDNCSLEEKPYIEPSVNGVLLDGDFSASVEGKMPTINSNDAKTSQIWAGSTVVKDPQDSTNLCTTFGYELQQYVPKLKSNTTYYLTYKYKNNPAKEGTAANFWTAVVELGTRDVVGEMNKQGFIKSSDENWKLVKREFTTGQLDPNKKYAFRFISPATADNVLLDDIGLYEKATAISVDTTSYRGGSAMVSSPYCAIGDSVTFTAKEDDDCIFLGWLENGDASKPYVSTDLIYTTKVTSSLNLVAVFQQKVYDVNSDTFLNADAESGNLDYWMNRYPEKDAEITVDSTESHSGKYSFKVTAPKDEIYRFNTQRGILLRPNCEYKLSVWVKIDGPLVRTGFYDGGELDKYLEGTNDFVFPSRGLHPDITVIHTIGTEYSIDWPYSAHTLTRPNSKWYIGVDEDGWVELTSTFVTSAADSGHILNYVIGSQSGIGTFWFDDLTVTYKELDLSTRTADMPFSEWGTNSIENGDFEKGLSATNLNVPQSWKIVKDGTAPERTAYLKIPANSGVYVKEMTVDNMRWSVLAYYIKTNKAGTSYIGLTDQDPTQNADFSNPQALGIYSSRPTTQWQRDGWKMYANNFTKMWVVIYSGTNDLYLDQLQFFYGDFGFKSDPNDYDLTDPYDYEGDGVLYDELDVKYKQVMQQQFGAGSGAPVDYAANTAATGDEKPILPAVFILLSCAAVCALALRKGRVNHEK